MIYKKVLADVEAGTWKKGDLWWGVKEGAVNIDNFGSEVPADVKKLAEERRDGLKSGKLHPFTGPLKDQSGKEFLAAGKVYTDAELKKMNFYVQGVEGTVPK